MTIRPITPEDQSEWLRMRSALWPGCTQERHRLEMEEWGASQGKGVVLVAHQETKSLCGFVEVSIRNDHVDGTSSTPVAYIEGWYVDSDFRGRGLGRKLL